jgi:proton-translocating NAD(P)+ transhydrogenase subunit beta
MTANLLINASYFVVAVLFITGMKRMSSPVSARGGIVWAGAGMVIATLVTFLFPRMSHFGLVILAIIIGGAIAWWTGKRVQMTAMPQMIALYNGMGGGAAAVIAALELSKPGHTAATRGLALLGALIGSISFSGSLVAFSKLQELMTGVIRYERQNLVNSATLAVALVLGAALVIVEPAPTWLVTAFFLVSLAFGILMTVPIGGADMPVVISLYNAFTGLAVGFEGFVLNNAAMIVAGTVVGAAGTLLTQLMAKAMNRSLAKLLAPSAAPVSSQAVAGSQKAIEAQDAAIMLAYAQKVIIVPGYGMAVAQAQHKVWELTQLLDQRGIEVKFAIHPVAGRMPGHMNVLLAEAGVNYERIFDLDEINPEFAQADVALVIGANDVVNPVARTDPSSPIYGMPILNVDHAKNAIVIKRGQGAGFSGIENSLFYMDNTRMFYGSGQEAVNQLIQQIKQV